MAAFARKCYVTVYGATPLLPCCCINFESNELREAPSHNHLLITCVESLISKFWKKPEKRLWIGVREAGPPIHVREARWRRSKAGASRACVHHKWEMVRRVILAQKCERR